MKKKKGGGGRGGRKRPRTGKEKRKKKKKNLLSPTPTLAVVKSPLGFSSSLRVLDLEQAIPALLVSVQQLPPVNKTRNCISMPKGTSCPTMYVAYTWQKTHGRINTLPDDLSRTTWHTEKNSSYLVSSSNKTPLLAQCNAHTHTPPQKKTKKNNRYARVDQGKDEVATACQCEGKKEGKERRRRGGKFLIFHRIQLA